MTYDVMGLPPSLVLGVHWTEKVEGEVAVARSSVGEDGGTGIKDGKYQQFKFAVSTYKYSGTTLFQTPYYDTRKPKPLMVLRCGLREPS